MLILDFDPASRLGIELQGILESAGTATVELCARQQVDGPVDAFAGVASLSPSVILLVLPPASLQESEMLVDAVRRRAAEAPLVAVTAGGQPRDILRLLDLGIHDFISAPFRAWDVLPRIWRLAASARETATDFGRLKKRVGLRQLLGESPSFVGVLETIPLVARCDASVLISGETGTGKELVARAIHYLSPRANKPFVAVNCGALPTGLVENELFGHERSAYTGAFEHQGGLVQEAEGGTLLLDEIDTLPLAAQVKLLRFLQEKEFRPLGSARAQKADVRVLAASNSDLESAVREGRLRHDLYYRLNVVPLRLPPLRERRDDIPRLARHFLRKHNLAERRAEFSGRALQALLEYDWPGNVRELEHVVERAAVLSGDAELIRQQHIVLTQSSATPVTRAAETFRRAKANAVARFEASYVRELLAAYGGNISRAARAAAKNRRAFWELIRKHGIDARSFRALDRSDEL